MKKVKPGSLIIGPPGLKRTPAPNCLLCEGPRLFDVSHYCKPIKEKRMNKPLQQCGVCGTRHANVIPGECTGGAPPKDTQIIFAHGSGRTQLNEPTTGQSDPLKPSLSLLSKLGSSSL